MFKAGGSQKSIFSMIQSDSINILLPADELNQLVTVELPDKPVPFSAQAEPLSPGTVLFF